ncbi:MAG: acetyl-CoA carboxylase carboxyltransferase subunit alpha [Acidobacteriota bacterium]
MSEETFEEPIAKLREEFLAVEGFGPEADKQRAKLQRKLEDLQAKIYSSLTPWQEAIVARHAQRPYTLDYVRMLCEDFVEQHGDRRFADDPAIVAGTASFRGRQVVVIGHQKGRNAKERIERNFGMPRPEGYRKALRLMKQAEKFNRPILTFIDTPGAYPGIEAEERGQAEAIAVSLREMAALTCPIIVSITGEGGSGGALAIGVGDAILMLEHSVYSVISPEGCAAILWRDAAKKREAAKAMKIRAADLLELGVIDEVVPEALGGAHADADQTAEHLGDAVERHLARLEGLDTETMLQERYEKFRRMGRFEERIEE